MKKLTLIIFAFDVDDTISKKLVQIVDTNKILFNCYPGVYMYIFETSYDIFQCEEVIEELGYNFVLFDTTQKTEYFRINGYTEFIEMFIDNNIDYDIVMSDEDREQYLIHKAKDLGNDALTPEEHEFLINRMKLD
jgi:hypothetical protein